MNELNETLRKMAEKAIANAEETFGCPMVIDEGERKVVTEAILAELHAAYQLAAANGGV